MMHKARIASAMAVSVALISLAACQKTPEVPAQPVQDAPGVSGSTTPTTAPSGDVQTTPDAAGEARPTPNTPPLAEKPGTTIPKAFQGKWASSASMCKQRNMDDGKLDIGPATLQFWESVGEVEAVVVSGNTMTVTAQYEGEGETWRNEDRFTLSNDGKSLAGEGITRVRCP